MKFLLLLFVLISLDCFSPIEIEGIAEVCGLSTSEVLKQLADVGMHGLPGGGAEMLVDSVRNDISPKKGEPKNWLRIMEEAQSLGLTTSATNVIGFGETIRDRVEHLNRIRDLQDSSLAQYNIGFTSFIAWPVQLETNTFGKRNRGSNKFTLGAGPTEYLRHVAISRLFLDSIEHIQASWPTMGVEIAQMALLCGADDAGSTMMGSGIGEGIDRAEDAIRQAIASPLLEDVNVQDAKGLLINITSDGSLTNGEFEAIGEHIGSLVDEEEADVIVGTTIDESLEDRIKVTVVATGMNNTQTLKTQENINEKIVDIKLDPVISNKEIISEQEPEILVNNFEDEIFRNTDG